MYTVVDVDLQAERNMAGALMYSIALSGWKQIDGENDDGANASTDIAAIKARRYCTDMFLPKCFQGILRGQIKVFYSYINYQVFDL